MRLCQSTSRSFRCVTEHARQLVDARHEAARGARFAAHQSVLGDQWERDRSARIDDDIVDVGVLDFAPASGFAGGRAGKTTPVRCVGGELKKEVVASLGRVQQDLMKRRLRL